MNQIELDENGQRFLIEVLKKTKGDTATKVSMFDVGAPLGMDKNLSSRTAEVLIGWELVEVRTLAGAIGITDEGIKTARRLGGSAATNNNNNNAVLSNAPILNDAGRKTLDQIMETELKAQAGNLGLDFDALTELTADLKTIDAQLTSSRPKTAIIRECLRSISNVLEKAEARQSFEKIKAFLGE